jgi:hypothetical protein
MNPSSTLLPDRAAAGRGSPPRRSLKPSPRHRNIWPTRVFSQKNSLVAVRVSSLERSISMCDYSLHLVASRPAKVGDVLVATDFERSITRGFAAVGEPGVAVCLLPGTELAFEDNVQYDRAFSLFGRARVEHKVARFRQVNMDDPNIHHDALEFPGGQIVMVTRLTPGQKATVLQLPATAHDQRVKASGEQRTPASLDL